MSSVAANNIVSEVIAENVDVDNEFEEVCIGQDFIVDEVTEGSTEVEKNNLGKRFPTAEKECPPVIRPVWKGDDVK